MIGLTAYEERCAVNKDVLSTLEYEIAVLVRLITATRPTNPKLATLDRSAYLILHQLDHCQAPLALRTLADLVKVDLSTMSRQVSSMETKGLVRRISSPPEARGNYVSMTAIGAQQLDIMREARRATYAEILVDWPDTEREELARMIGRLNQSIRHYKERDPSPKADGPHEHP